MAPQLKKHAILVTSPYTVKEMWDMCPRGLWMEVLQKLDVVNCRRLSRVSRRWRDILLVVPQANNGVLHLKIKNDKTQVRMENCLEVCLGGECYCDLAYHSTKDASGVTIIQRRDTFADQQLLDVERTWWCNLLGVTDPAVVSALLIDTEFPGTARRIGCGPTKTNSTHCLVKHARALSCIIVGQHDRFEAPGHRWFQRERYQLDPLTSSFVRVPRHEVAAKISIRCF